MSPALNESSTLECFERSNASEIRNGIMFDFYPGLPHIYTLYMYLCQFSFFFSLYRRDRLWIAMEYCGGGSLQDIYHGTLRVRLMSIYQCNNVVPYCFVA